MTTFLFFAIVATIAMMGYLCDVIHQHGTRIKKAERQLETLITIINVAVESLEVEHNLAQPD